MHGEDMEAFCKDFGDWLKNRCKGSQAFVYFGDKELVKYVGLKTSMKMPLRNGRAGWTVGLVRAVLRVAGRSQEGRGWTETPQAGDGWRRA